MQSFNNADIKGLREDCLGPYICLCVAIRYYLSNTVYFSCLITQLEGEGPGLGMTVSQQCITVFGLYRDVPSAILGLLIERDQGGGQGLCRVVQGKLYSWWDRWGMEMMGGRGLLPMVICIPSLFWDPQSIKLMLQQQREGWDWTKDAKEEGQIWIFPSCWGLRRCCGPAVYHGNCVDLIWMKVQQQCITFHTRVRYAATLNRHQLLSTSDLCVLCSCSAVTFDLWVYVSTTL